MKFSTLHAVDRRAGDAAKMDTDVEKSRRRPINPMGALPERNIVSAAKSPAGESPVRFRNSSVGFGALEEVAIRDILYELAGRGRESFSARGLSFYETAKPKKTPDPLG